MIPARKSVTWALRATIATTLGDYLHCQRMSALWARIEALTSTR